MTTAHRKLFRPGSKVRLSQEAREKLVAVPTMRGVVVRQSADQVTVKEDGAGHEYDYHVDFLEIEPVQHRQPVRRLRRSV